MLDQYLSSNADAFVRDTTYTFQQVYFNPDQFGVEEQAAEHLAALIAGDAAPGDGGMLPASFENSPARAVDSTFGTGFASRLDALPVGKWQGPVESGLGFHLVRIAGRFEGTLPDLADIRPIVEREWANEQRLKIRSRINDQLLSQYEVVIEWPTE